MGTKHEQSIERYLDILRMREAGATMEEIGIKYGVTRARVSQIISAGMPKKQGRKPWKNVPLGGIEQFQDEDR